MKYSYSCAIPFRISNIKPKPNRNCYLAMSRVAAHRPCSSAFVINPIDDSTNVKCVSNSIPHFAMTHQRHQFKKNIRNPNSPNMRRQFKLTLTIMTKTEAETFGAYL